MQMGDKARRTILGVLYRDEFLTRIEGCSIRKPEQERKQQRGRTLEVPLPSLQPQKGNEIGEQRTRPPAVWPQPFMP